jgi:hypothetical protein
MRRRVPKLIVTEQLRQAQLNPGIPGAECAQNSLPKSNWPKRRHLGF